MKIAVIISGEFRSFETCWPSMSFLHNRDDVDFYFSTWNISKVVNESLNLHVEEEITEDKIKSIMQVPVTIDIASGFQECRYNSKMINRWLTGYEMVKKSGIEYSHLVVIRPDLFFKVDSEFRINLDQLACDRVLFAWYKEGAKLQDNFFAGPIHSIDKILDRLTVAEWNAAAETDWHVWWTDFVFSKIDTIFRLGGHAPFAFCRYPIKKDPSFEDIERAEILWRNTQMLDFMDVHGRELPVISWGEEIVSQVEKEVSDTEFTIDNEGLMSAVSKFGEHLVRRILRKRKQSTAVIISGEIRNTSASQLSLHIWKSPYFFISTWDTCDTRLLTVKPTLTILSNESEMSELPFEATWGVNQYRMMFLWTKLQQIPDVFDSYVIIRPDIFYWDEGFEIQYGQIKTLSMNLDWCQDQLFVVDRAGLAILANAYVAALNQTAASEVHIFLANFLNARNIDFSSTMGLKLNPIIQRDIFTSLESDGYDVDTARAVYAAAATWWRQNNKARYGGIPPISHQLV